MQVSQRAEINIIQLTKAIVLPPLSPLMDSLCRCMGFNYPRAEIIHLHNFFLVRKNHSYLLPHKLFKETPTPSIFSSQKCSARIESAKITGNANAVNTMPFTVKMTTPLNRKITFEYALTLNKSDQMFPKQHIFQISCTSQQVREHLSQYCAI